MDLILQLNAQLKEMENEIDKLVQEKQASMEAVTVTAIPIVTITVSSTLVALVATTSPVATSLPTASAIGSTIATTHPSDEAGKLIKAMQDISIQTNEINRLKEQIKGLEDEKEVAQIMRKSETQKSNRLTERIQKLEKELTLKEPLSQAKKQIWANIINSVNDIFPSIQVIFEQNDLVKEAGEAIQRVRAKLGNKPEEASRIETIL